MMDIEDPTNDSTDVLATLKKCVGGSIEIFIPTLLDTSDRCFVPVG